MNDCIFCKIVKDVVITKKVYENENFVSFADANPIKEGHTLVIPKKHYKTTLDMPSTLGHELLDCIKNTTIELMKNDKSIEGFNVVNNNFKIAGQVVDHVHFHIIPRRKGDGLKIVG